MEQLPTYYTHLFNAVTDALSAMEQQNFGEAKDLLIKAQQASEELWLECTDTK